MALILTPPATAIVYSDGQGSNQVSIRVADVTGPLTLRTITGTTPGGTVIITNPTDAQGQLGVAIATDASGPMTLTLTDPSTGQSGTCTVTAVAYDFGGFQYSPPYIAVPGAETVTSQLHDKGKQTPADGIPLSWVAAASPAPAYLPAKKIITAKTTPSSFQYVTQQLQQSDIDALSSGPIQMKLEVGGDSTFFYPIQISTGAPLQAPAFALPPVLGTTIDDEMIQVCTAEGIPFRIPSIANTSMNDTVTILASQTLTGPALAVLASQPIARMEEDGTDSLPFITTVPTTNVAFDTNGPLYIYYSIYRAITGALSLSERLPSKVQRTQVPGPPDGTPNPGLTPPSTDINVYTVEDLGNGTPMLVTIDFNGTIQPSVGDTITPVIYLVGYTSANYNWVKKIELLPAYTLVNADFSGTGFIPKTFTFTNDKFSSIDGSNGQLYFLYQQGQNPVTRSPARSIIVDTIPPHSLEARALRKAFA